MSAPPRDVKLAMDSESEAVILSVLRAGSHHEVISEEAPPTDVTETSAAPVWLVDPLDGSVNYLRGVPLCCVSIGLWQRGKPVLGVVHDFNRDETFTAIVGLGSWHNGVEMRVSDVAERSEAVLGTGFPAATSFDRTALLEYVEHVRQFKKTRLLGSAALSLAYVACGRLDAYYERDIRVWDVGAGLALVAAAGGTLVTVPSSRKHMMTVYAANAALAAISET